MFNKARGTEYLIDWADWAGQSYAPTWEPSSSFFDRFLINEFEKTRAAASPRGRDRARSPATSSPAGSGKSAASASSPSPAARKSSRTSLRGTSGATAGSPPATSPVRRALYKSGARSDDGERATSPPPSQRSRVPTDAVSHEANQELQPLCTPRRLVGEVVAICCYIVHALSFMMLLGFSSNVFPPSTWPAPLRDMWAQWLNGMHVDGASQHPPLSAAEVAACASASASSSSWLALAASLGRPLGLFLLFVVHHGVLNQPRLQNLVASVVTKPLERLGYVVASGLGMWGLMAGWSAWASPSLRCTLLWNLPSVFFTGLAGRPTGGWQTMLWVLGSLLDLGAVCGALLVLLAILTMALRDVHRHRQNCIPGLVMPTIAELAPTPLAYRIVRHPIFTGTVLAVACTSTMTLSHAIWALLWAGYVRLGVGRMEDGILRRARTEARVLRLWSAYMQRVPKLIPAWMGGKPESKDSMMRLRNAL